MRNDPYDARVAFDDLPGEPRARPPLVDRTGRQFARLADRVREVVGRVASRRVRVPLLFASVRVDPTASTFQVEWRGPDTIVGLGERLPLFASIRRWFYKAQSSPKIVRVDSLATYEDFRDLRRVPHLMRFEAAHTALAEGDDVLGEVFEAAREVERGGRPIALGPHLAGKVEAWRDGDEVLCTIRYLDRGGLRLATTGIPFDDCLENVIECAGDGLDDVLPVIEPLAEVLGGRRLLGELCGAAQILETNRAKSPIIVAVSPRSDPDLSAAMALQQLCQRGDLPAQIEADLMRADGHGDFLDRAGEVLARAQVEKRSRR